MKASEKSVFYDIYPTSLNRQGEELCGDQVKVLRTRGKTIVVLSDGLGSGVKANILARLTSEIIVTMIRADAQLKDVIETVVGTQPMCKVRKIAYATFIVIEIQHATGQFKVINFDSPAAFFLKQGKLVRLQEHMETVQGKQLSMSEGVLEQGDFLGVISDGVLYAGMGVTMNFGWGWEQVAAHLEQAAQGRVNCAEELVRSVMKQTQLLYNSNVGDDATMTGILVRHANRLMVFTGPPTDKASDPACVERLLEFDGRKVVCGGTTGNIVAGHMGKTVEMDMSTLREELPPIGILPEVDLLTEGILTLAKTLQLLKLCRGREESLPEDRNGAVLLTRELLRADSIFFLAGEKVNPFYQNPLLPKSVSIRRSVLDQIVEELTGIHKEVKVEWS
jgi:hypothetical protein